jgi:hypothetical protein
LDAFGRVETDDTISILYSSPAPLRFADDDIRSLVWHAYFAIGRPAGIGAAGDTLVGLHVEVLRIGQRTNVVLLMRPARWTFLAQYDSTVLRGYSFIGADESHA